MLTDGQSVPLRIMSPDVGGEMRLQLDVFKWWDWTENVVAKFNSHGRM